MMQWFETTFLACDQHMLRKRRQLVPRFSNFSGKSIKRERACFFLIEFVPNWRSSRMRGVNWRFYTIHQKVNIDKLYNLLIMWSDDGIKTKGFLFFSAPKRSPPVNLLIPRDKRQLNGKSSLVSCLCADRRQR
jgi:hypothetical protein